MKKILFLNCCIRENSRTLRLSQSYLDKIKNESEYQIEEVFLSTLDISPLNRQSLDTRDKDIACGNTDSDKYRLAHEFAAADKIVIAAPYWDSSFPSVLKVYIENISVKGITFECGDDGKPVKKCHADSLVYITTSGGFINKNPGVKIFMEELCSWFVIDDFKFYCAQGLDIIPDKVDNILSGTLSEMSSEL